MARIRTIKPEFWTDERLMECSLAARLLFIGTWNFADDAGNLHRSPKRLKALIFPSDAIECEPLVLELIDRGLLREYQAEGATWLHIIGFVKHQLINRPSKTNIPPCAAPVDCVNPHGAVREDSVSTHGGLTEDSVSTHGGLSEHSLRAHGGLTDGREGKGKERKGAAAVAETSARGGAPPAGAVPIADWLAACLRAAGSAVPLGAPDVVERWRADGISLERVVVPTIAARVDAAQSPPRSWRYFDAAVREAAARDRAVAGDGLDEALRMIDALDRRDARERGSGDG